MSRLAIQDEYVTLAAFRLLEADAPADERWELLGGTVWRTMTGGTKAHNTIVQTIAGRLRADLRRSDRGCRPFTENIRVVDEAADLSAFPDVVVDCGPFLPHATVASEPVVVVEVLSTATRNKDLRAKGPRYRQVASIRAILFVDPDRPFVEVHRRAGEGFLVETREGLQATIVLPEIGAELALSDVYEDAL